METPENPSPESPSGRLHARLRPSHQSVVPSNPTGRSALLKDYALPLVASNPQRYDTLLEEMEPLVPAAAIADIRHKRTLLEDAIANFHQVRADAYSELETWNENARAADRAIDECLQDLRDERARVDAETLDRVELARARRVAARKALVVAMAEAGMDVSGVAADPDDEDSTPRPPSTPSRAEDVGGQATTETAPRGAVARLANPLQWLRSRGQDLSPAARSTMPPPEQPTPSTPPRPARVSAPDGGNDSIVRYVVGDIEAAVAVRAKPLEAFAVDHGLPRQWFAAGNPTTEPLWLTIALWLPRFLPTFVCGGLFGISLGQVLGIVDVRTLITSPDLESLPGAFAAAAGVVIFTAIGRTIQPFCAYTGQLWAQWMIASTGGVRERIGRILWCKAIIGLAYAVSVTFALVLIEANVERHGLLRAFLDRDTNRILAGGQSNAPTAGPQGAEIWFLVLSIVLPYVLAQWTSGWIHGWTSAAKDWLISLHTVEVARVRKAEYEKEVERLAQSNALALEHHHQILRSRLQSPEDTKTIVRAPDTEAPSAFDDDIPAEFGAELDHFLPATERLPESESLGAPPPEASALINDLDRVQPSLGQGTAPAIVSDALGSGPLTPVAMVALARIENSDAEGELRMVRARRMQALEPIDREIARYEALRVDERHSLPSELNGKMDLAYSVLQRAAGSYQRSFEALRRRCDRLGRRDLPALVHRALLDNPTPRK